MDEQLKNTLDNLTENEIKLLPVLFSSSKGNGHDFGFTDVAFGVFSDPNTHPGVLASLQKKGIIHIFAPEITYGDKWTQFNFGDSKEPDFVIIQAVEFYLEREAAQGESAHPEYDLKAVTIPIDGEIVVTVGDEDVEPSPVDPLKTSRTYIIRVERTITQFAEVEVMARDLVEAGSEAVRSGRTDIAWTRVIGETAIRAVSEIIPPLKRESENATWVVVRSDNRSLLVGRLVHNDHGWIFLSNASSLGDGRVRREVMFEAIPDWARKGTEVMSFSAWKPYLENSDD